MNQDKREAINQSAERWDVVLLGLVLSLFRLALKIFLWVVGGMIVIGVVFQLLFLGIQYLQTTGMG